MQIIRGLQNLKKIDGCTATIGNFDGVHLAHQKILKDLTTCAKQQNLPSVVISFYPNPAKFFGKNIAELSSFKEKYQLLKQNNIDILVLIHFNQNFASINPQRFIDEILLGSLNTKKLFIGDDFRFGKNRSGDFHLLKQYITTVKTQEFLMDGMRVSSSNIRKLLWQGKFNNVSKLLGRDFSICGTIIHGAKLGKTIGFATANLAIKNRVLPLSGVFQTTIIINNKKYKSITNIGTKPTISGSLKLSVETHIFDFNQDIYNQTICVIFEKKIRDEKKFNSIDGLKNQITMDIQSITV